MASRGVNKVILVGTLGQDPEIRYAPNGGAIANISVATSESWNDRNSGEKKEVTEWHRVVIFGKLAEIAGEYLKKGSQVYFEGQLRTRKWEKDGIERYSTEVIIPQMGGVMQMLGGKKQDENQQHNGNNNGWGRPKQPQGNNNQFGGGAHSSPQQPQSSPGSNNSEPPMDFDDDIPFAPIGLQYSSHSLHSL